MQYLVAINQTKALEWGLNAQQAMLFAFLHQVPTWAASRQIDGRTFFNISKTKIVAELPLLTDKPDTAYRLMKQLATAGLIVMTSCDNKTYIRLTDKAIAWNRLEGSEKNPTSEKYPSRVGKKSVKGRKILRQIKIPVIKIPVILLMTLARPASRRRSIALITNRPMRPTRMSVPSRPARLTIRTCPTCSTLSIPELCRLV